MSCYHRRHSCNPCCPPTAVPVPVPVKSAGGSVLPLILLFLAAFLFLGNSGDPGTNTNIINVNSDSYEDDLDVPECCCKRKC